MQVKKTLENLQDVFRPTVGCRYVQMFFVGFLLGPNKRKANISLDWFVGENLHRKPMDNFTIKLIGFSG